MFQRFVEKEKISDRDLYIAIENADKDLIKANLGGGVIKQRISRVNEGKSGGYRSIILFRSGDKAFFVYGYAKNKRGNIGQKEEKAFKELANELLGYNDIALKKLIKAGVLLEVTHNDDK